MQGVRTFRLGDGRTVVALHGELGDADAAALAAAIGRGRLGGPVVVDLLGAVPVDDRALAALLPWLRLTGVTVVADPQLLPHVLGVLPSLAEALG